jgi:hypothetical protein
VAKDGMMAAIGKARFGDTARTPQGGKGLEGVVPRDADYFNPFLEVLEADREGSVEPGRSLATAGEGARG